MIKGKLYFLLFFAVIALFHFAIASVFPQPYFNHQLILCYVVLVLISFVGNTLLQFALKKEDKSAFSEMFLVFTTIQMLVAMSFSAYLIYGGFQFKKELVLQFIILFFLSLIFQSLFFIRLAKRNSEQKNT